MGNFHNIVEESKYCNYRS